MLSLKVVINYVIVFLLTFIILFSLLIAATAIPNRLIEENYTNALSIIDHEGDYPSYFFDNAPAIQDNSTDRIIIQQTLNSERDTLLEAAMHRTYARYWHGYCVVLRPFMVIFSSLYQIRYAAMIAYVLLFGLAVLLIGVKINIQSAIAFIIAISMTYPVVVMTSLQFFPMFLIAFIAVIIELTFPVFTQRNKAAFYLIIGMLTSFIDLLTAPIITLGLPLIVLIMSDNREDNGGSHIFQDILACSFSWFAGYGLTWAMKWLLGTVILKENVLAEAAETIAFRTTGNNDWPGGTLNDRFKAVKTNIEVLFTYQGLRITLIILAVILLIIIIGLIKRKKQPIWKFLSIVFIGLFPYIWYFLLSNHSIIHDWFTYRAQAVSVFALFAVVLDMVDWSSFGATDKLDKLGKLL